MNIIRINDVPYFARQLACTQEDHHNGISQQWEVANVLTGGEGKLVRWEKMGLNTEDVGFCLTTLAGVRLTFVTVTGLKLNDYGTWIFA